MTNRQSKKKLLQNMDILQLTAEQEQFFSKTVIDSIHGSFFMLDANARLVRWNDFLRDEITGRSESEMEGANVVEFFHPDDRLIVTQAIQNALNKGAEELIEVRSFIHGGPEICWRLITGRRIVIDGKPFVIGMGMDITERKKAEQALFKSEERFKKLFECHSAIKILIDPDTGNIIDANHAAAEFYGWSIEELKQMNLHHINHISHEDIKANLDKIRSSEKNQFLFRHHRADGSIRDVEVFSSNIVFEDKDHLYAIIYDVTERMRYESLTAFRLRFLEIAETSSVDRMLKIALDEAERMTGSSIGFFHFVEDDQTAISKQTWSTNTIKGSCEAKENEVDFQLKDSAVWMDTIRTQRAVIDHDDGAIKYYKVMQDLYTDVRCELIVPVIRGNKVSAVVGVGNKRGAYDKDDIEMLETLADITWDIVARKRSELSEQDTRDALIQSQKMELIGQLAGGIAHDFNNMLGVIIGNIEMAIDRQTIEEPLRRNLKDILKATERSANLTRQLLAFARKQPVMPIVLDLNNIVENMLSMLRRLIGENIAIVWIPCRQSALVKVDPSQIDQILINLCVNARDAISGIGKITIETGVIRVDKADCGTVSPCKVPGEYVILSITDDGCGIEKEHLFHIFEPFFTTKDEGAATGLGLSTVYGIVKQNMGCIDFQSKMNQGTTFNIYLPRHKGYSDPDEGGQPESSDDDRKKTILLVEDEPEILHLCESMLKKNGYIVLSVTKPHDAIQIAAKYPGEINLLLTDVVMPEMNGSDLSKKLQSSIPNLKTLFMSGYTADVFLSQKARRDKIHFIQKPFSFRSLIGSVREILSMDEQ